MIDLPSWTNIAAIIATIVLTGAFALKIADWPSLAIWIDELGLPAARKLALLGLASEAALIGAIALQPKAGLAFTVFWLIPATALLIMSRRRRLGCNCFGSTRTSSEAAIARNAILALGCAVAVIVGPPTTTTPGLFGAVVIGVVVALTARRTLAAAT